MKRNYSPACAKYMPRFSEYTDVQIGRIIDHLKATGQYENTIIMYAADNGASGEGTPNGSVNENKFFNGYPDDLAENMKLIDELGGPNTYEHYPTGWAAAFSTPFKMFKRYSNYSGGTADPLVISWPKGIKARGEVRNQYHHAVDIVPTILEICGLEMPKVYRGVEQYPVIRGFDEVFLRCQTGCIPLKNMFSIMQCWEPVRFGRMAGKQLLCMRHLQARAISIRINGNCTMWMLTVQSLHDLAKENPEKLEALKKLWDEEAEKNFAKPLDDRTAMQIMNTERPTEEAARELIPIIRIPVPYLKQWQ